MGFMGLGLLLDNTNCFWNTHTVQQPLFLMLSSILIFDAVLFLCLFWLFRGSNGLLFLAWAIIKKKLF